MCTRPIGVGRCGGWGDRSHWLFILSVLLQHFLLCGILSWSALKLFNQDSSVLFTSHYTQKTKILVSCLFHALFTRERESADKFNIISRLTCWYRFLPIFFNWQHLQKKECFSLPYELHSDYSRLSYNIHYSISKYSEILYRLPS